MSANQIQNQKLIRLPAVMEKVGLQKSAIYDLMKIGKFPRQKIIGSHAVAWVESEIDAWILDLPSSGEEEDHEQKKAA